MSVWFDQLGTGGGGGGVGGGGGGVLLRGRRGLGEREGTGGGLRFYSSGLAVREVRVCLLVGWLLNVPATC